MLNNIGPGTYILVISMQNDTEVEVGRLGQVSFPAGHYLYVGSALGGLAARLARHTSSHKKLYWHIDYVLEAGQLVEIWYREGRTRHECEWARALAIGPSTRPFQAPLGASDCACYTHLFWSLERPVMADLSQSLGGGDEMVWMPIS